MLKVGDIVRIEDNYTHYCFNGAVGIITNIDKLLRYGKFTITIISILSKHKPKYSFAIGEWYMFDYNTKLTKMGSIDSLKNYINTLVENVKP